MALLAASGSIFGAALLGSIVPAVSVELALVAASAALPSSYALALIVAATAGQMLGKAGMFYGGRGVKRLESGRVRQAMSALDDRIRDHGAATGWLLLASATTGLPPFYLVAVASGATGVSFTRFAVLGTVGRFIRFAAIVALPEAVKMVL